MPTVNETRIGGFINAPNNVGGILNPVRASGSLSTPISVKGSSSLASVVDRTAIHYDTTEAWNSTPNLIAEQGHFYVYSDYDQTLNDDGSIKYISAVKVGDGTSYLIDMPFIGGGQIDSEDLINHINNWSIHVASNDRTNWNEKVTASVDIDDENLILSI